MEKVGHSAEGSDDIQERRLAFRKLSLYIVLTIVVSCVLLIINVGMVYSLYTSVAIYIPEVYSKQIGQLILLSGPFVLLFPEWMLYDILITPFRRWR